MAEVAATALEAMWDVPRSARRHLAGHPEAELIPHRIRSGFALVRAASG